MQNGLTFRQIQKAGPLLVLPVHKSAWDGFWLRWKLGRIHFVAKTSLRGTFLGWLLSWGGTLFLPADAKFKEAVRKRLRQKIPIGLFLEGKRVPEGLMGEAKTGALQVILECLEEDGLMEAARWAPVGISYKESSARITVGTPQKFYHTVPGTLWQFAQGALREAYALTQKLHLVPGTICYLFYHAVGRFPNETAILHQGKTLTWAQLKEKVEKVSKGLWLRGFRPGDRIAIFAETCPEWEILDLAIILFGGVTVGIHPHLSQGEADKIIQQTEAKLIALREIPKLVAEGSNQMPEWEQACAQIGPETVFTIIYTAGTTDQPKGIPLTHKNIVSIITAFPPEGKKITGTLFVYLPLSHILQRVALYRHFVGPTIAAFGSIKTFAQDLKQARPTTMAAVPEVLYRIREGMLKKIDGEPKWRQKLFAWALEHKDNPIAYHLVLKKVYNFFGGRLKYIGCGGAPLPKDLAEFFWACRVKVLEGYGMSETSAPIAINTPQAFKLGTVGKPFPGAQIRIAEDGEILVKSPGLSGTLPQEWFPTGDLGQFDEDGFLIITGRKQEIIVLSTGEKVHPQIIEEKLQEPVWIDRVVVFGEGKPYLVALFVLSPLGEGKNLTQHIQKINNTLAKFEQIKNFSVVQEEAVGLKFNRQEFYQRHRQTIEQLYAAGRRI